MIFPRADMFDLCGVRDVSFWPLYRQELSREAGGRSQGKDMGPPLWRASFTTSPAHLGEAQDIEAALISLGGLRGSFLAHDLRRPFPKMHPDGDFADTAQIAALPTSNAHLIQLGNLAPGLTLSPGDYLSFQWGPRPSRALHMVMGLDSGSLTVNGSGTTGVLEVSPAILPGASVGASVTLKRASCEMRLDPGQQPPTLKNLVTSSVTFSGVQLP